MTVGRFVHIYWDCFQSQLLFSICWFICCFSMEATYFWLLLQILFDFHTNQLLCIMFVHMICVFNETKLCLSIFAYLGWFPVGLLCGYSHTGIGLDFANLGRFLPAFCWCTAPVQCNYEAFPVVKPTRDSVEFVLHSTESRCHIMQVWKATSFFAAGYGSVHTTS